MLGWVKKLKNVSRNVIVKEVLSLGISEQIKKTRSKSEHVFLWVIVCGDSAAVNTGWKSEAISSLEETLGHKVMWSICQLHINELGLRQLIEDLDGPTASGNTLTGPIVKMLTD